MQPVIGLLMARRFPRGGPAETAEEPVLWDVGNVVFFHFYITAVITLAGG